MIRISPIIFAEINIWNDDRPAIRGDDELATTLKSSEAYDDETEYLRMRLRRRASRESTLSGHARI